MHSTRKLAARAISSQMGITSVEFVGCILAVGGGLALGSMYLGVDMKSAAVSILEQADIIDPEVLGLTRDEESPTASQPEANQQQPPTVAEDAQTPADQHDATVDDEELTIVEDGAVVLTDDATPDGDAKLLKEAPADLTEQEREIATKYYWNGLTECIREEANRRYSGIKDPSEWQLFDYLTHRKKGHEKAIQLLQQLEKRGVDERLVAHGKRVLAWQEEGADLFGRAVDLLTDGPTAGLTGPFAQTWQSAATQHRMEETLVRNKHLAVASYLDHEYDGLAPFEPATAR